MRRTCGKDARFAALGVKKHLRRHTLQLERASNEHGARRGDGKQQVGRQRGAGWARRRALGGRRRTSSAGQLTPSCALCSS